MRFKTIHWVCMPTNKSMFALLFVFAAPLFADAVIVDGKSNLVLSGITAFNPSGPCVEIRNNSNNIRIVNSTIGPCGSSGIRVSNSSNITIDSSYIHDTGTNGFDVWWVTGITISNNEIDRASAGVYALTSTGVKIDHNHFLNIQGPVPRGQFVQFDKVQGGGNRVTCNVGENLAGQSFPEEGINMWSSSGDPSDPILIKGNKIKGGGPSLYGGGLMLGDGGGAYQTAEDNILVDPGQQGIAVASGTNIVVQRNQVYARQQSFTNVGLYVWNQYQSCSNITVQNNLINFTNKYGQQSSMWSGGGCGTVTGWSSNTKSAPISDTIFDQAISSCQGSDTTPPSGAGSTSYLTDLAYRVVANGWGPVEKDRSNGEMAAGDGRTLTIRGTPYGKGFGTHSYSEIRYSMNGMCSAFSATIGIDDEARGLGSVTFEVWADGARLFGSGLLTGVSPARAINVDVTGKTELELVVTNGNGDGSSDHADWADARVTCSGVPQ